MQHSPVTTYTSWLSSRGALARTPSPQVDFTTLGMFIIGVFVSPPDSRNTMKCYDDKHYIPHSQDLYITLSHPLPYVTKHHESKPRSN